MLTNMPCPEPSLVKRVVIVVGHEYLADETAHLVDHDPYPAIAAGTSGTIWIAIIQVPDQFPHQITTTASSPPTHRTDRSISPSLRCEMKPPAHCMS